MLVFARRPLNPARMGIWYIDGMVTRTKLMSLEEFLLLPEQKPYLELIDGEVEQKPVGKLPHSRAQARLLYLLVDYSQTIGGEALPEQGVKFVRTPRGNFRVPDVSYFASRAIGDDYPDYPPTLAIEVRSKGQSLTALQTRLAFLREQGALCTLLVDPTNRRVEVVDGERTWTAVVGDEVSLDALPGFRFAVADLFD
jgi:Uma2 family endonuclease